MFWPRRAGTTLCAITLPLSTYSFSTFSPGAQPKHGVVRDEPVRPDGELCGAGAGDVIALLAVPAHVPYRIPVFPVYGVKVAVAALYARRRGPAVYPLAARVVR